MTKEKVSRTTGAKNEKVPKITKVEVRRALGENRKIAEEYNVPLGRIGTNFDRYWCFMETYRKQCEILSEEYHNYDILKAIDEYNYCHYTKGWI